jgi:hypothetical protein
MEVAVEDLEAMVDLLEAAVEHHSDHADIHSPEFYVSNISREHWCTLK